MKKHILFVDDDRILRRLVQKKMEAYANDFLTVLATDGMDAVEKLKNDTISLVVTDLHMPKMDGFSLLAYLTEHYPDIPAIILTAFATPDSKRAVLESGATGFMEKPFGVEELVRKIKTALTKQVEGGVLQSVPLSTFIQLIEMEQKTCTIRVVNRVSQVRGVLFIKEGELFDARIKDRHGKEAAFEILSWEKVTLAIQDTCVLKENRIGIGLQAILFDAMRLMDESLAGDVPMEAMGAFETGEELNLENQSPVDRMRHRISDLLRGRPGLESVEVTTEWDHLTAIAAELGNAIAADELKACFIDSGEKVQTILLPGDETIEVKLNSHFPREIIRNVLYE
jgi:CheY-like chemotaxis protein